MECKTCKEIYEASEKGFPITDIVRYHTCNQPERSKREDFPMKQHKIKGSYPKLDPQIVPLGRCGALNTMETS